MGCGVSLPATADGGGAAPRSPRAGAGASGPAAKAPAGRQAPQAQAARLHAAAGAAAGDPMLSPAELLDACAAALAAAAGAEPRLAACPRVTAAALCALALVESSGDPRCRHRGADLHGLWAMPLPTARWLASKQGWSRHPSPSAAALEQPAVAAYFAAALLATMHGWGGRARSERFAITAFRAGAEAAAADQRRRRLRRRAAAACGGAAGGESSGSGSGAEAAGGDAGGGSGGDDECDDSVPACDGGGGGAAAVLGVGTGWQYQQQQVQQVQQVQQQQPYARDSPAELSALWRKYKRAKGLVQQLACALEVRRAGERGGGGGGGGLGGGEALGLCGLGGGGGGMMHLVRQGETLKRIAAISGTSVADLLAANPDLPGEAALQPFDLITLPVAAVPPRLHALRPGDSLRALARAHGVPLGRLLAKNPELGDPRALTPGYVVLIPGLRGDSESAPAGSGSGGAGGGGAGGGGGGGGGGGASGLAQLQFAQMQLAHAQLVGGGAGGGGGGGDAFASAAAAAAAAAAARRRSEDAAWALPGAHSVQLPAWATPPTARAGGGGGGGSWGDTRITPPPRWAPASDPAFAPVPF
ncbi:hypothetical protein Rsub_00355 [Raphidocelis subcapitata]|uniref:LysM domain-containing protein n=1 Tax=Raphidocelis subcapitata TaxID=307507 RepID=A0A2V0NK42_9CHLO|nr:hypothetical protein Rsub_00355 [Raphidocelis subcapitata]|eukprot:GBF87644.1 hypothetical protein Rsub_00355 [Raphidocelis subcapitata]